MHTNQQNNKIIQKWDDLPLKEDILRGIYVYGFETPSPIQKKAILPILEGRDVIGQAQSGTGKTGTFTIGTLNKIDTNIYQTQAMILAPTHELAKQISMVVCGIGSTIKNLRVKTIIGKSSIEDDINDIRFNIPHIVVGCPGRICDLLRRNVLNGNHIQIFALDEADEMLSDRLKTQIYNIFQYINPEVQVIIFSATIPNDVIAITEKFMRNPVEITMNAENLSLECIQQYYIALTNDNAKYSCLCDLFSSISISQCIIYCNSVERVNDLYRFMINDGYPVCCIHSNMTKTEREKSFTDFRTGVFRVLISSNVTARGIDIQQVSTVINFDICNCVHTYLHRIGRGGRWGKKGIAINFVTKYDIRKMRDIEKHYNIFIHELNSQSLTNIL